MSPAGLLQERRSKKSLLTCRGRCLREKLETKKTAECRVEEKKPGKGEGKRRESANQSSGGEFFPQLQIRYPEKEGGFKEETTFDVRSQKEMLRKNVSGTEKRGRI